VCEVQKHSGSDTKDYQLDDTRICIVSHDAKSSAALQGTGSQVTSQSLGSPLGHMNLPQQSQYSGIPFTHKFNIHKQSMSK
jgi:hypothetical protein